MKILEDYNNFKTNPNKLTIIAMLGIWTVYKGSPKHS